MGLTCCVKNERNEREEDMGMQHYIISVSGGLLDRKNYYSGITESKPFVSPLKNLGEKTILIEEDICRNDSYRQHTKYNDKIDSYYSTYDLGILLENQDSYLEGELSHKEDVDYYSFSYQQKGLYSRMGISSEITIQLETVSEKSDYAITIYDIYGNQIGMATGDGECKKVILPDWDGVASQYIIRVENRTTGEIGDGSYKIKISEKRGITENSTGIQHMKELSETGNLTEKEQIRKKYEEYYREQLHRLHQEQYNSLPENEKYGGTETVSQLLEKMASGTALSQQEKNYIKIFANITDYERAEAAGNINMVLYDEVTNQLKQAGIDVTGKDFEIELGLDNKLIIIGDFEDEMSVEIEREFADKLRGYYLQASHISNVMYNYIDSYMDVGRFLEKSTGGAYSWDTIEVDENGIISGLPSKMCELLNSQECNARYEELQDKIYMITDCKAKGRMQGILDFTVKYHVSDTGMNIIDVPENSAMANSGSYYAALKPIR